MTTAPLPTSYKIKNIEISPPTVLAPMEGITDRDFRLLIRSLGGCGLAVTEFVSSDSLTNDVARAWKMAEIDASEHPISIQIYGRDPERMAEASKMCEDLGADIVDINLGCPSKAVTSGCAGSALMREPDRAQAIFEAVGKAIQVPFTVKMRLGWDHKSLNAVDLARRAQDAGAQQVVVHGRTREQSYGGIADWDAVGRVKAALSIPVIVNGDILTVDDGVEALRRSGADGVMVGRGVLRNPWILLQIGQYLHGQPVFKPTLPDRLSVLLRYIDGLEGQGEGRLHMPLNQVKRVTGYFTRGIPHSTLIRESLYRARSLYEARVSLKDFFAGLEADGLAEEFDRVIEDERDPRLRPGDSRTLQRRPQSQTKSQTQT
jgi:tRNA-dihydrouridine synthase B